MFAERPKKLSAASLKCCIDRLSKSRKEAKSNAEQHQDANMAERTVKCSSEIRAVTKVPRCFGCWGGSETINSHPALSTGCITAGTMGSFSLIFIFICWFMAFDAFLLFLRASFDSFRGANDSFDQGQGGSSGEQQKHDVKEEEDSRVDSILPDIPAGAFCSICREGPSTHLDDSEHDDGDDSGAMIQLSSCQHHAHLACLKQQLAARWAGKKISFHYLQCGECRAPLAHDALTCLLTPHHRLQKEVEALCVQQASVDDLIPDLALKLQADREETTAQCMAALSCFMCSQCSEPFCGGRVDCAQDDELDISVLKCPACAFEVPRKNPDKVATAGAHMGPSSSGWLGKCQAHGYKFAIYKCDSCCSVATWDCRSNHYCTPCHELAYSSKDNKCPAESGGICPLGIPHPPNKPGVHGNVDDGFVIGCSKCFLLGGSEQEAVAQKELEVFELATDSSSRDAAINWKDRF